MPESFVARGIDPLIARARRSPIPTGVLVFALLVALEVATVAAQGGAPSEAVSYSRAPQEVVVSYLEELGEIEDEDPGPSLKVYGDGRVLVHYPEYMKRAGDYTLRLSDAEMAALLRSLVDKGLLDFDEPAARASREQLARSAAAQREVFYTSEVSVITIEVHANQVEGRVSWSNLRQDAIRFPQVRAIQDLAAAHRELQQLMERKDLTRIESESGPP